MTLLAPELDLPPEHPLRQILDTIAAHPELREPVLRVLLTDRFLALPEQVQGLTDRVDELQTSFDDFREETREQFRAVNERIDQSVNAVNERIDQSANTVVRRMEGSLGRFRGESYEKKCAEKIDMILVDHFDYAVEVDRTEIIDRLAQARHRGSISREEYLDGRNVDIIAQEKPGFNNAENHLAAVEVSITFNRGDLETAARRARIIERVLGLRTDAFVATNSDWPDEVNEVALRLGVTIIHHHEPAYVADF